MELFIKNGARLNGRYFFYQNGHFKLGDSPIIAAIKKGHLGVVRILLKQGVSPIERLSDTDKSPLDIAKELGDKEMIKLLSSNQ